MKKSTTIFAAIAVFCAGGAGADMDEGTNMRNRFIEGYQMGYQHGLQDGIVQGQLTTPENVERHKKAMEGHGDFHSTIPYKPTESFRIFSEKLGLTPEQQEKVRPLLNAEVSEIQEILADSSVPRERKRKLIEETVEKTGAEINQLLTPEQQKLFQQMTEQRKGMYRMMGETAR